MREEKPYKIETHVAGICFKDDKVLIAKRASNRKLYPDLWECGGGQVHPGESFREAVIRQLQEELGVNVEIIDVMDTYEIPVPHLDQKKIPGIYFTCNIIGFINGIEPQLSTEHIEWQWAGFYELVKYKFIPGLKEQIQKAFSSR